MDSNTVPKSVRFTNTKSIAPAFAPATTPPAPLEDSLKKRDISWLHFNARVLQEAADPRVPLYERIKFLAIFSSNLDEFYRVRVASLRQFRMLPKQQRRELFDFKPKAELRTIRALVHEQQEEFGRIFREEILPALADEGIHLIHADEMSDEQRRFAADYFDHSLQPHLELHWLPAPGEGPEDHDLPFINNGQLCLAVEFAEPAATETQEVGLVVIPSPPLNRFLVLPAPAEDSGSYHVIFLDSIIRDNLGRWLDREVAFGYSFKLSRDAELYIDNEFDGDLLRKIEHSLTTRDLGLPTRFLYHEAMPKWIRKRLKRALGLSKYDMIPGARYHNFNDFFGFPLPEGRHDLVYPELPPLPHPRLEGNPDGVMGTMLHSDLLLSFPYQKYDYVPQLIREAADDPAVTRIRITLYRVAKQSNVVTNLLYALERGKEVEAFVEAKARFDEASNLFWGKEMEEAGAYVRYSYPAVKVHTKLLHILRPEADGRETHFSYIGTGNFNEKTARLYTDHALLTCRPELGEDVERVFDLLRGRLILPNCRKLLVAPFNMQPDFEALIEAEIRTAEAGRHAYLFLKMNSLEEPGMIALLRRAAAAGVEVRLIVRGICRLEPTPEENIQIISIIDRFLEHARIFIFGNDGAELVFMGSADWMNRNLYRRVEVVTPVEDNILKLELRRLMDLQWRDNQRARIINQQRLNHYRDRPEEEGEFRAQTDIYHYFKSKITDSQL